MKYTVRKFYVIYQDGSRDKVNLERPIHTDNIESLRTRLIMKHTIVGKKCIGLNLEYDELNNDGYDVND